MTTGIFNIGVEKKSLANVLFFLSERLPLFIRLSQNRALNELGSFFQEEIEKFISSGGKDWPVRSNVAEKYTTAGKSGGVVFREKDKSVGKGLLFLMKYFQWRVENEGTEHSLFVDFGGSSRKEIDFLIKQVQTGASITITNRMRRAFGYTETPLKKETKTIEIPPREVGAPVFRQTKGQIFFKFVDSFLPALKEIYQNA